MQAIYPYNNPQNLESGYFESWNVESTMQYPNKVSKKMLDEAIGLVNFRGISLGKSFAYCPFITPTNSKAYLFEGVVVIYSALKNPEIFVSVPSETLTIIAKTKEQIFKVAKELYLPLEELVQTA